MNADSPVANPEVNFYRIFGLVVCSELALPEANRLKNAEIHAVDVYLQLGNVPDTLPGGRTPAPWLHFLNQICILSFRGVGRFLVEKGSSILVEKHPDATYDDLRGYLFGSAFGVLAHQRGLIPLHVSAVATPQGCVAFTGESGAGKSTIAAQLNKEVGWSLISDDLAVLNREAGGYSLRSGINTTKLWRDSLTALGRGVEGLRRDLTRYEKFHAVEPHRFEIGQQPLAAIVVLGWGGDVICERLVGREAAHAAIQSVYRPEFGVLFGNRATLVSEMLELASVVPFAILKRPRNFSQLHDIAQAVQAIAESKRAPF